MTNYKVTNLNDKTPEPQRQKLETNLKAIDGVDTVKLHPATSEISLAFRSPQQPKKDVIATAVSKAGFTMESQP